MHFYLLCHITAERQQNSTTNNVKSKGAGENGTAHAPPEPTWVHEIFQVWRIIHTTYFTQLYQFRVY